MSGLILKCHVIRLNRDDIYQLPSDPNNPIYEEKIESANYPSTYQSNYSTNCPSSLASIQPLRCNNMTVVSKEDLSKCWDDYWNKEEEIYSPEIQSSNEDINSPAISERLEIDKHQQFKRILSAVVRYQRERTTYLTFYYLIAICLSISLVIMLGRIAYVWSREHELENPSSY